MYVCMYVCIFTCTYACSHTYVCMCASSMDTHTYTSTMHTHTHKTNIHVVETILKYCTHASNFAPCLHHYRAGMCFIGTFMRIMCHCCMGSRTLSTSLSSWYVSYQDIHTHVVSLTHEIWCLEYIIITLVCVLLIKTFIHF